MSKVLKVVAVVAGAVALVATGVGAFAVAGSALAATAASVATIASLVAGVAALGAQITAPKPQARGSPTNVIVDPEPPRPYMVGESYSAGILRHQVGYGATLNRVPNPYLLRVLVFSGVGPVAALVAQQFDFQAIGSYYSGFYDSDTQLGARPESTALVPPYGAAPGWTSASKLSGCAAIAANYKFDKDGKVFASGIPQHGAIWQGELAYDPRLDSSQPGGSGSHVLGDESTYTYTTNPALHAGTYAYGRFEGDIKLFGLGLPRDAIDWESVMDWANTCDANSWECHGTLYEGGAGADIERQRLANLDDLCAAGGGRWLLAGAVLTFDWQRPRVPLATLTDDDWLEEGCNATAIQSYRDRMNGVRPVYVSPSHNWEQITAEEIVGTTYRTEDDQPLTQTWALNLVKDATQAGELASYAMADTREIGPIEITVGAEWRFYRPGETLTLDSDLLGYTGPVVILRREFDPSTFAVKLTLKTETDGKHAFALGQVAVPPATATLGQTGEERDAVIGSTVIDANEVTFNEVAPLDVQLDSTGAVSTELPISRTIKLYKGGIQQTSGVSVSAVNITAGITASTSVASGEVQVDLDSADVNGAIILEIDFEDLTYQRAIAVNRIPGSVSGGDPASTTFTDSSWTPISSTTDAQVTDSGAIVRSNSSGELRYRASSGYNGDGAAVVTLQYSLDGSSWTDFAAGTTGSTAEGGAEPLQGFVSIAATTKTGLTASTDYYVRAIARRASGSGVLSWVSSTFNVRQP